MIQTWSRHDFARSCNSTHDHAKPCSSMIDHAWRGKDSHAWFMQYRTWTRHGLAQSWVIMHDFPWFMQRHAWPRKIMFNHAWRGKNSRPWLMHAQAQSWMIIHETAWFMQKHAWLCKIMFNHALSCSWLANIYLKKTSKCITVLESCLSLFHIFIFITYKFNFENIYLFKNCSKIIKFHILNFDN